MIFISLILLLLNNANATMKIALVDTGLNLKDPRFSAHLCLDGHYDATGEGIEDTHGHSTHLAGLIIKYAKDADYCLIIIKAFDEGLSTRSYLKGLRWAVAQNPDIVNLSLGGKTKLNREAYIISNNPSTIFIVAAGNNGENLDKEDNKYYPASHDFLNIIVVGSMKNNIVSNFSNYGKIVDKWEDGENVLSCAIGKGNVRMSGSSMSTAIYTGKYIYEISKKSN